MKTTLPPLASACSARDAQMGRPDIKPVDSQAAIKLRLYRLAWQDGDYDSGGAYWGNNGRGSMYRAVSQDKRHWLSNWDGTPQEPRHIEIFVRAGTHHDAKNLVKSELPNACFYR